MDHKSFIDEMHRLSGLDRAIIERLLSSTCHVLGEQAVNLNSVSLDGIGVFQPRKRLEFIHRNRKTGQRMLYPPRIAIRFIPSDRLVSAIREID